MANNVTVQVIGSQPSVITTPLGTVGDAFRAAQLSGNYTASVNGQPAQMSDTLPEYAFVSFAENVKGGC